MKRGVTDRTMQRWWRRAVLVKNFHRCAVCGQVKPSESLECHHLIRRRYRVTRHDWRNGVPVCAGECHSIADRTSAELIAQSRHRDYLVARKQIGTIKKYLSSQKMSLQQFDAATLEKLKEIVNEGH